MRSRLWVCGWIVLAALGTATVEAREGEDAARREALTTLMDANRERHPTVPEVTPGELEAMLAEGEDVVLVDVRTEEEMAISMIPGALTLADFRARSEELAGRRVVTYCHSGGRSAARAEELIGEGWQAWTFNGSLLLWSHHGGELVDPDGEPTRRVSTSEQGAAILAGDYEPVY